MTHSQSGGRVLSIALACYEAAFVLILTRSPPAFHNVVRDECTYASHLHVTCDPPPLSSAIFKVPGVSDA
jgi:hypothetical protein